MSLWRHLRQYDARQTPLERHVREHPGSKIAAMREDCRYLCLSLNNAAQDEAEAYLDLDRWLCEMAVHLPGIAWQQVPSGYLLRWLNNMQLSFLVENTLWNVQAMTMFNQELPGEMLLIPAKPCPLLCFQWPVTQNRDMQTGGRLYAQMPFTLRYVLGNSQLPLSVLIDVALGDLLLITRYSPCLTIGQRRLFTFHYHQDQEIIVEQQIYEESQEYRAEEEALLQWSKLPVDIEFVLDSHTVTLAELNNIAPGEVMPLSPQAEKTVKIYLNKALFARGELVALESGMLAVEINQINQLADGLVDYPNAE
ncbi:FliM/FliN family flagellar motor switch protein [Erwinia psidii]|uniref:Type III secretion system protein n=1 Tax=Erwinia psidii TaxID=69224 RepID=A0A3N6SGC3_9GAMM|nr:FliM/FliN family flagellar motor switch protein [Erwinia psidii]MCX8958712.1 type III secretion system protein [Erwinia psidii]MCX8961158.1 type III secretion system protein [Erwinia psidii]MCX8966670.1 type III secretion system protein [Erwinia psidii]RQM38953.1 type III secretion system protein [Erwinia psidii]